jgi:hypothetical protein
LLYFTLRLPIANIVLTIALNIVNVVNVVNVVIVNVVVVVVVVGIELRF